MKTPTEWQDRYWQLLESKHEVPNYKRQNAWEQLVREIQADALQLEPPKPMAMLLSASMPTEDVQKAHCLLQVMGLGANFNEWFPDMSTVIRRLIRLKNDIGLSRIQTIIVTRPRTNIHLGKRTDLVDE